MLIWKWKKLNNPEIINKEKYIEVKIEKYQKSIENQSIENQENQIKLKQTPYEYILLVK